MLKSTLLISGTFVLGLLLQAQVTSALPDNEENLSDKELEIRALTTLSGSERAAKRMHRTIERYRVYRSRVDAKIAKGVDEDKVSGRGHETSARYVESLHVATSKSARDPMEDYPSYP